MRFPPVGRIRRVSHIDYCVLPGTAVGTPEGTPPRLVELSRD